MRHGDHDSERLAIERLRDYAGLFKRQGQDHGIQLSILQHEAERRREILFEFQRHFRCTFVKNRNQRRKEIRSDRCDDAKPQHAPQLVLAL